MKRLILIAAGAFALVAGSAHAGGLPNCAYENGAQVADSELERIADETDPGLLALLKKDCLLYTPPSPRDLSTSRMPSSA